MKDITKSVAQLLKQNIKSQPKVACVLGSGYKGFSQTCDIEYKIDIGQIEGYPKCTVQGHGGQIVVGKLNGVSVLMFEGRQHIYEGYSSYEVTLPVRLAAEMGCKAVVLTNAAGAVNMSYSVGDTVAISDHIALNIKNPLIDLSDGNYFIDMHNVYDAEFIDIFKSNAAKRGVKSHSGVYMYFSGPSFETPAEIRMARALGADLVGMSTVAEAIMAHKLSLRTLAVSYISNMAAGITKGKLDHTTISKFSADIKNSLFNVLSDTITQMHDKI